jgi:hypothetical protein
VAVALLAAAPKGTVVVGVAVGGLARRFPATGNCAGLARIAGGLCAAPPKRRVSWGLPLGLAIAVGPWLSGRSVLRAVCVLVTGGMLSAAFSGLSRVLAWETGPDCSRAQSTDGAATLVSGWLRTAGGGTSTE